MSWHFVRFDDRTGAEIRKYSVQALHPWYLVAQSGRALFPAPTPPALASILGIVTIEPWGAKLRAVNDHLRITPGRPQEDARVSPPTEEYLLKPNDGAQSEVIFLRNGDRICSEQAPAKITLVWDAPQVQVNSSVTPGEIAEAEEVKESDAASPEEETEDDEDVELDRTVVPKEVTKSQLSHSTPLPPASRTEVVQETPTADRVNNVVNLPVAETFSTAPLEQAESGNNEGQLLEKTADVDVKIQAGSPTLAVSESIQRRVHHPKVQISKKRASPTPDGDARSPSSSFAKRRKTESVAGGNATIAIHHPVRQTATKSRKRVSDAEPEETLPLSSRDSQQSVVDDGEYDGEKPRVAFSNSAITSTTHAMKFLKKHGGIGVDSINDACNILCVKDGTLSKTMKLLQSIALGIAVVTDKWLMDSAKVGRLLPLEPYVPNVPIQEEEWKFSMSAVWNVPQNTLFQSYTILFTPSLKATYKDFREIEQVCKTVGARKVFSKKPNAKDIDAEDIIILAAEEDEADAGTLDESCFSKDLLANSILRGTLDLDSDEFKIKPKAVEAPKKKGRSKKG